MHPAPNCPRCPTTRTRDTYNLLSHLARSAFTAAIPLAIVSGNEDKRKKFIRAGAAAWMTKPLKIPEVERTTMGLLELNSPW